MNLTTTLNYWYSEHKREMPWRETRDPYCIWLSEIILQQTQIKQGLPYYQSFVTTFPTVFDLANASEETVLKLWQGLGYYSRARNLHHTAKYIAHDLKGVFPNTYKELLKLKGVGDYTASAVGSICFNLPTAVVDGNVYRVLARYFGVHTPINSTAGIKEFKKIAQKLIDIKHPGDYNQAIMEFGAIQCKPSSPNCNLCPLSKNCKAFNANTVGQLPVKLRTTKVKKKFYNYMVIVTENKRTVIERRTGKGIWQSLYQFPLIESNKSLSLEALKAHESFRALTVEADAVKLFNKNEIIHKLSHQHLYTKFWIVQSEKLEHTTIPISDIKKYPVPILIGNFIDVFFRKNLPMPSV